VRHPQHRDRNTLDVDVIAFEHALEPTAAAVTWQAAHECIRTTR
jgi:hypothetical protein